MSYMRDNFRTKVYVMCKDMRDYFYYGVVMGCGIWMIMMMAKQRLHSASIKGVAATRQLLP